eukprot:CAMPEP_0201624818 /NCGR_PEP_ID=MMETSP0493-20130528/865_1 /ASSEMBLY_ACC=CAM_ASM_000838 /TAXON_ID=420259 /ORGANISM="Thalassiosira gravida, Strain GMp14c1" /LENGTH=119 /DNA_ID=CAMNT_0048094721 /DNA_START=472 /DNA_END=831 /DNA_ORIENTATION=+
MARPSHSSRVHAVFVCPISFPVSVSGEVSGGVGDDVSSKVGGGVGDDVSSKVGGGVGDDEITSSMLEVGLGVGSGVVDGLPGRVTKSEGALVLLVPASTVEAAVARRRASESTVPCIIL